MLDKSFGLLFYLKKPKGYGKGPIPIYLRITVDGIPKELSTKRTCDPNRWNSAAERAVGTKEDIRALNTYLDTLQAKTYEAKRQLIETNQLVSASLIKDSLLGNSQRNKMIIKIFQEDNERVQKLIGIDYSKATWTKYDRTKRFIKNFIQFKYHVDDLPIQVLDMEFVNSLEFWFKTERKCGQNATMKYISILKMVILFCVDNDWLLKDPFSRFKMIKEEVIPQFLTKEEIQIISGKQIKIERLKQVRDVFLFCCFTGLAYVDIKNLNASEVSNGFDDGYGFLCAGRKQTYHHEYHFYRPAKKY